MTDKEDRHSVLCYQQVQRLHELMERSIEIDARTQRLPTVVLRLKDLVQRVLARLQAAGIEVSDVRLNGGGATHVVGMDSSQNYNDLDLLFGVDLGEGQEMVERIRNCVLLCLRSFLSDEQLQQLPPDNSSSSSSSSSEQMHAYVRKLVRVSNSDSWCLIGLGYGQLSVELKFVHRLRRQFEFTVDSFQLLLDSLLSYYTVRRCRRMSEHLYPTVVAEAVSGSFSAAYRHLRRRQISTRRPEEIRGGGLLKYCKLLLDGFSPAPDTNSVQLQKYMCSRFFIDFPQLGQQRDKVCAYIRCHLQQQPSQQAAYLRILHGVVRASTVCLMQQERQATLWLLAALIEQLQPHSDSEAGDEEGDEAGDEEAIIELEQFNNGNWILQNVHYGTEMFPRHLMLPAAC